MLGCVSEVQQLTGVMLLSPDAFVVANILCQAAEFLHEQLVMNMEFVLALGVEACQVFAADTGAALHVFSGMAGLAAAAFWAWAAAASEARLVVIYSHMDPAAILAAEGCSAATIAWFLEASCGRDRGQARTGDG